MNNDSSYAKIDWKIKQEIPERKTIDIFNIEQWHLVDTTFFDGSTKNSQTVPLFKSWSW